MGKIVMSTSSPVKITSLQGDVSTTTGAIRPCEASTIFIPVSAFLQHIAHAYCAWFAYSLGWTEHWQPLLVSTRADVVGSSSITRGSSSTRFSSLTRTSMPAASIADTKSDNDCCGMGIPLLPCCGDYWVTSCEE